MTRASARKPWWVRARGQHSRGRAIVWALFLTVSTGGGLFTASRNGNSLLVAVSVVGVILALWMWAVVIWQLRHRDDGEEADGGD